MRLARRCLTALGLAATVVAASMVATVQPADAEYRCNWKVCKRWEGVRGTIGARCISTIYVSRLVRDIRECNVLKGTNF
jgi:hypothetical protein